MIYVTAAAAAGGGGVAGQVPVEERAAKLLDKGNKSRLRLRNLTMRHVVGNPLFRRELASLAEAIDPADANAAVT